MSANLEEYRSRLRDALGTIQQLKAKLDTVAKMRGEPIAIIGMACRLPLGGETPEAWFQSLLDGRDGVTEVPAERWKLGPLPEDPTQRGVRWGAFVEGVDRFDASFFGISPREASRLDPQQRFLLMLTWEALERAGIVPGQLLDSKTGVFLGLMTNDYALLNAKLDSDALDAYSATGNGHCFPAGRISYSFGFRGPSFVVDTACSSSLVALHLACASLRSRESDLAIVGGVNLMLSEATTELFSKTRALSPDGRCKTFDAAANGYVRGEGCAVLVLQRMSDAQRDKNTIHALIRGSAVNQDGRSTGLTTPNVLAQEALLRAALENAGVAASSIGYVEAHGTGTPLGDPIEVDALRSVLGEPRPDGSQCILGALKTNIGHLEAAAGVASAIKVVLALRQGVVPKNLHLRAQNPRVDLEGSALALAKGNLAWGQRGSPRRAGISSFGMSGTNAHVILEEAPLDVAKPAKEPPAYLLPLSAKTPAALLAQARAYGEWLSAPNEISLPDAVYTASVRRTQHEHRLCAAFSTREEAAVLLSAFAKGESPSGVVHGKTSTQRRAKVAYVFSGQGSQWAEMGKRLLNDSPVFRAKVEEVDAELRKYAAFSVIEEISIPEDLSHLGETEIVQPALFAIQVGLFALLQSWGVTPDAVIGHSVGEVAAAHVSGALSLADACRLVALRGKIMQKATGLGKMAWVSLARSDAEKAIAGRTDALAIGAINDPASVVLSGETAALESLLAELSARGVVTRALRVNYAFHSPQMEALSAELETLVGQLDARAGSITMYSTVTGRRVQGNELGASYWRRNVREAVDFAAAMGAACAEGHSLFVEVGPHPVLKANIEQCLADGAVGEGKALQTLKRKADELRAMLETVGALHVEGVEVAWKNQFPEGGRVVSLPAYAWQRERYWIETTEHSVQMPATQREPLDDWLYAVEWRRDEKVLSAQKYPVGKRGPWLLFLDARGVGTKLADALESRGEACIRVYVGNEYARVAPNEYRISPSSPGAFQELLQDALANGVCSGVVHLWGLDGAPFEETTLEGLRSAEVHGCVSALHLTQALAKLGWRDKPRLWFISSGAVTTGSLDSSVSVSQASIWGLGRSIALEHTELGCTRVDLPAHSIDDVEPLLRELLSGSSEDQVALRSDGRYVARLVRRTLQDLPTAHFELRADGSYLITGGLGGLGLSVAEWLVQSGARHVVLTSRREPSPNAQEVIGRLEKSGAHIVVALGDIANRQDAERILHMLAASMPPLRGVVHAAGVVDDHTILELKAEHFRTVFAPKIDGAWNLHTLTKGDKLDFFVMYSSVASLLGAPGQGNYAAANAFLDALAHARKAAGLCALSIHWGPFADVGMAAAHENRGARISSRGIDAFSTSQGTYALSKLLSRAETEIGVLQFAVRQWREFFPQLSGQPFWSGLSGEVASDQTALPSLRAELSGKDVGARLRALEAHVREQLVRVLRMQAAQIASETPFQSLGVDSLMSLEVRNRLEASLGLKLPATLLFTYTNLGALTKYLIEELTPTLAEPTAVVEPEPAHIADEPIAMIGMACRFPGGGDNPEAYFQSLMDGVDAVREVVPLRFHAGSVGDDKPGANFAALLNDIEFFDASYFGISPREAEVLDPQQRMLLEVSVEALENAGQPVDALKGSTTGVFVGITALDYQRLVMSDPAHLDAYGATGTMLSTAAGRLSYVLGLEGPAVALDTACSSSLVSIHLACQSLRAGECDLAIAGGANALLAWENMVTLATMRALSPDGRCKTLDSRANGYVRGEGCGIVILKRLADARRDGDHVLALVRGSAVNQDGRSTGLTAPNVLAQEKLLRTALRSAHLAAGDIGYVEMHGTGTPLGDPIEADALRDVFGKPRDDGSKCVLGAVKTNIGHLESAAGVAGVIKVVEALHHEVIPQNLHFRALNPRVSFEGTPLFVPTDAVPWPRTGKPRRAGISSFGLSGTNAHVILEEAPLDGVKPAKEASFYLLPISAKTSEGLKALANSYAEWLSAPNEISLPDAVYTASVRRTQHEHRLCAAFSTREEAAVLLSAFAKGESPSGVVHGKISTQRRAKVAYVFSGQGSQWAEMGKRLLNDSPVFRAKVEEVDAELRKYAAFSVIEEISIPEDLSHLGETEIVQPALFAIQVGLFALLQSWGVTPDAVIGHSVGEVAAAHVSGALSLADACRLVALRGKIMQKATGLGKMAWVSLARADAEKAIAGRTDALAIGAINDPDSVVLSGETAALESLLAEFSSRGVVMRALRVNYAFHSPQMEALSAELEALVGQLDARAGSITMYSTVTGRRVQGNELGASYWRRNVREAVDFAAAMGAACAEGHSLFVEVGPHPVLKANIEQCLAAGAVVEGKALQTLKRKGDELRAMLETVGALHVEGVEVAWKNQFPEGGRVVSLPAYAWQRERYWIEATSTLQKTHLMQEEGGHPLLGIGLDMSLEPERHVFQQRISIAAFPFLKDHVVQEQVVFPGTGYLELANAAGAHVFGERACQVESISFVQMLALREDAKRDLQVSLIEEGGGRATLTVMSRADGDKQWMEHASGVLRVGATSAAKPAVERPQEWELRCPEVVDGSTHYSQMAARGLSYGPAFQGVERIRLGKEECVARVRLPSEVKEIEPYYVHPALLDACFQASALLLGAVLGEGTYVPVEVSGMRIFDRVPRDVWVHAQLMRSVAERIPSISLVLRDDAGNALVEVHSLRVQRLVEAAEAKKQPFADCLFEVSWQKTRRILPVEPQREEAAEWLILCDRGAVGAGVAERLRGRGHRCVEVSAGPSYVQVGADRYEIDTTDASHWDRFLQSAFSKRGLRGILHCAALDGARWNDTTESTIASELRMALLSAMRLSQAVLRQGYRDTPKLYVLTRGAQAAGETILPVSATQSTLWGFGRVIAVEQPDLACVLLDLDWAPQTSEAEEVVQELFAEGEEEQVALRREGRYVARLLRGQWEKPVAERKEHARGRPYRLEIREPGVLEKLALRPMVRTAPGPGEVEIEVEAAGLNFIDLLKAMGIYPGMDRQAIRLGSECAGRVVALGEGVTGFAIGDEVIASGQSCFARFVTTRAAFAVKKPARLSFEEAAAIPGVFTTVLWSLRDVARLAKGERILIHSATGGTGLAAIQYAKAVGAEIFATAGSEEKRARLRSMGIEHVMDSRTTAFADECLARTGGRGVDVVLNSLSGEGWNESLRALAPYGRFLDLSKKDIYENSRLNLLEFRKSLSFTAIDLAGMAESAPERFGALLAQAVAFFEEGTFQPEPLHVFQAHEALEAFQLMAKAGHVGKIVLRMNDPDALIVVAGRPGQAEITPDATYFITGGLGGLGLTLAEWFVENGARSIAFMGRGAPSETALAAIGRMQEAGANVSVLRGDVSRRSDVENAIEVIDRDMLPLRGIVHAAAVLDDHTLPEMTEEQLFRPLMPKVYGGFLLHELTRDRALDFFVMYSSVAGLIGSPGQANYAAANQFLDGLCEARVAQGLAGTSIQWGPFSGVGLAAAQENRGIRIASRGIVRLEPEEGNQLFELALRHPSPQMGLVRFEAKQWVEFHPQIAGSPYLSELLRDDSKAKVSDAARATFRDVLERASVAEREHLMDQHLAEQLGRVLRINPMKLERNAPFTALGMDSLMSLELRNRLEASLGLKLSTALLFTYATTAALSSYLLEKIHPVVSVAKEDHVELLAEKVESDEAVAGDDALLDKLDAIEEYLK